MVILRHRVVIVLVMVGLLAGASCKGGTASTSTSAPSKPAAASTSVPTSGTTSPAKEAESKPTSGTPPDKGPEKAQSASADRKSDWDRTVAAAKQEGKVAVNGANGDLYRTAAMGFRKAFPDIQLEYSGLEGTDFGPKVLAERDGGQYLWDVYTGGTTTPLTMLLPKGVFDPLKPTLMMPEVLDDKSWVGGLDDLWRDLGHKYILAFEGRLSYVVYVNRDVVSESELSSIDQLVDPKWKGKIASGDPRLTGSANGGTAWFLDVNGEGWLRKFFGQDLAIINDERLLAEALIRGRYPIVMGINPAPIELFKQQGLGANVKPLAPDSQAGVTLSNGKGNVGLINKAPHPNSAKVYINWLLSKEGQKAYVEATSMNSRRLDVEGPPEYRPKAGVKYVDHNKEEYAESKTRAMAIAKELLK